MAMPPAAEEDLLRMDTLSIVAADEDDAYDATGLGSVEQQLRDELFSNDLIAIEDYSMADDGLDTSTEVSAVAEPSPADRIAGEDRLSLRGFPTPALRNGFIQIGIPETLNTAQTIVIQGALVPVLGRAAPGGIQNFMTARPRTKPQTKAVGSVSTLDRTRITFENSGPLLPKKAWQRVVAEWHHRTGPQEFAREELRAAGAALSWKHSRAASTLLSFDYRRIDALASPGVPEFRPAGQGKIAGPYLPLATFNANGPAAGVRRESGTLAMLFDSQPTQSLAFRAGLVGWWRDVTQDRFTTSVLALDTGLFEGTREPRHLEQPQEAVAAHAELTKRLRAFGAEHKLMISGSHTWGNYLRSERALPVADRNALPLSVRRFNPHAPDYYSPEYSEERFSRVLVDRDEAVRYGSVEFSNRVAYQRGRTVLTAGLRYDEVALTVKDNREQATIPLTSDRTAQISYHAGANWQARPGKVLLFATTSTAFDPSTPVDARTGRIQDNETTLGYEAGVRGRAQKDKLNYSVSSFALFNQSIARRNPLYNDPVADANQTQPQLVASGEERFVGTRAEVRLQLTPGVNLHLKGNHTEAITTASPDLPQEVGRPITRLPSFTTTASLRYRTPGARGGPFYGATWQYLDGYVAHYEDSRRAHLQYPGYGIVIANAGYSWRRANRTIELDANVRNLFDRDLLNSHARLGAGRELILSLRMIF